MSPKSLPPFNQTQNLFDGVNFPKIAFSKIFKYELEFYCSHFDFMDSENVEQTSLLKMEKIIIDLVNKINRK